MNLNETWEENLTLNYIEGDTSCPENLNVIWLYFQFYDCEYTAALSKKDTLKNLETDFLSLGLEGSSKLFDSAEEILEEKYAQKIIDQFKRYQDWLIAEEEEMNKPIPPLDTTKYKIIHWLEYFTDEDNILEPVEIERRQVVDIDYELQENEYLEPKR